MKVNLPSRIVRALAVLAPAVGFMFASLIASNFTGSFKPFFQRELGGKPLPGLTIAMMSVAPHAALFGLVAALVYLVVAFMVIRSAQTMDSASMRSLILVSVMWILCFLVYSTVIIAFMLPFIPVIIDMNAQ